MIIPLKDRTVVKDTTPEQKLAWARHEVMASMDSKVLTYSWIPAEALKYRGGICKYIEKIITSAQKKTGGRAKCRQ